MTEQTTWLNSAFFISHPEVHFSLDLLLIALNFFSLITIVEHFLIPCLHDIATKYKLSEQSTGYLLALGACIPEFTTNMISIAVGNLNLGIGAITGSGSFDFSVCFGIASMFAGSRGLALNKALYYKESLVYLLSLAILTFFLNDNKINFNEAFVLLMMAPLYLYLSSFSLNSEEHYDTAKSFSGGEFDLTTTFSRKMK